MHKRSVLGELERWCGVECTGNRVGDVYFDQLRRSGHHDRPDDLDRIAEFGFAAIRYPLLWERVSPDTPDHADWSWCDARLTRLSVLGLCVIGGLIIHGSGPHYTNLSTSALPTDLHARRPQRPNDIRG